MRRVSIAQYTYTVTHVNPVRRTATYDPEAAPASCFFTYCRALFERDALPMETQTPTYVAEEITKLLNSLLKKHTYELIDVIPIETTSPAEMGPSGSRLSRRKPEEAKAQRRVTFSNEREVLLYDPAPVRHANNLLGNIASQEQALAEFEAEWHARHHGHHDHHHHSHHSEHAHGHHHGHSHTHTEEVPIEQVEGFAEALTDLESVKNALLEVEKEIFKGLGMESPFKETDPKPEKGATQRHPPQGNYFPPPKEVRLKQAQQANQYLHETITPKLLDTLSGACLAIPAERNNFFRFRPEVTAVPIGVRNPVTHAVQHRKGLYDANYIRCPNTVAAIAARRPTEALPNQRLFWEMQLQQRMTLLIDAQDPNQEPIDYYPNVVNTSRTYDHLSVTCTAATDNTVTLQIHNGQTRATQSLTVLIHRRPAQISRATARDLEALCNQVLLLSPRSATIACENGIGATGLVWAAILIAKQIDAGQMNWHNKEGKINRIVRGLKAQRHPFIVSTPQERIALSQLADHLLIAKDQATGRAATAMPPPESEETE